MTPAQRHLSKIHALPCVVHWAYYGQLVNMEEAHHLESVRGAHSDYATIPLCKSCHDELHGKRRRSFHIAHKTDDLKLLAWTIRLLMEPA